MVSLIHPRLFAALLLVAVTQGCAVHYVTRGADLYADGYYIEAAEVFERTEARLEASAAADRARYGLYRGATFLALGDAHGAERWLHYSEAQVRSDAAALSARDRALLGQMLQALAERRPSPPVPAEEPTLATTRSVTVGAEEPSAEP